MQPASTPMPDKPEIIRMGIMAAITGVIFLIIVAHAALWYSHKWLVDAYFYKIKTEENSVAKFEFDHRISGYPFSYKLVVDNLRITPHEAYKQKIRKQDSNFIDANYESIYIKGSLVAAMHLFNNFASISIPKDIRTEMDGGWMQVRFNSRPQITINYAPRNFHLFRYVFGLGTVDNDELLANMRDISYHDEGMVLSTPIGKRSKSYDSADFLMSVISDAKNNTVHFVGEIKNNYTKLGHDRWYYTYADSTIDDEKLRDLIIHLLESPTLPNNYDAQIDASVTTNRRRNTSESFTNMRIDVNSLILSNEQGSITQSLNWIMKGAQKSLHYTFATDNYRSTLDGLTEFMHYALVYFHSHDIPSNSNLGKAKNALMRLSPQEAAQIMPPLKQNLTAYLKELELLKEGNLAIKLHTSSRPITLNGRNLDYYKQMAQPYITNLQKQIQSQINSAKATSQPMRP